MDKNPPKKPKSLELPYLDWYMQYLAQYEIPGAYSQFRNYYPQKDGSGWDMDVANIFKKHLWKNKSIWYDSFVFPLEVSSDTMENLNPENTGKLLSHSINGEKITVTFTDSLVDSIRIKRVFRSTDESGETIEFWQMIKVASPDKWPAPATYNEYVLNEPTPISHLVGSRKEVVVVSQVGNSLSFSNVQNFKTVSIYSIDGRKLFSQNIAGISTVQLHNVPLSAGTYIIQLSGKMNSVQKILVK